MEVREAFVHLKIISQVFSEPVALGSNFLSAYQIFSPALSRPK